MVEDAARYFTWIPLGMRRSDGTGRSSSSLLLLFTRRCMLLSTAEQTAAVFLNFLLRRAKERSWPKQTQGIIYHIERCDCSGCDIWIQLPAHQNPECGVYMVDMDW
jgi:hypothetical protein